MIVNSVCLPHSTISFNEINFDFSFYAVQYICLNLAEPSKNLTEFI